MSGGWGFASRLSAGLLPAGGRDEAGTFPAEPLRLLGRNAEIILLAFDLAIPLGDLYREVKP
ncbi:hypothetical protein [Rhodoplanes azumiensis]|uniref:Uncharacterized protein n=1 Tax=Rhodoplanes azumiensis TaxID=1897628 RepID=A0ABW5AFT7_9BRAD